MGVACSSPAIHGSSLTQLVAEGDLEDIRHAVRDNGQLLYKQLCNNKLCTDISCRSGTPLHVAAQRGRTAVVQLLLHEAERLAAYKASCLRPGASSSASNRANTISKLVDSRNDRQQTPLMLAVGNGHMQCAQVLLDMGADRWATDTLGGRTALHYAARGNHALLVMLLLEGAADTPPGLLFPNTPSTRYVDVRTISGLTPLHLAVRAGALDAAAALLRAGALLAPRNVFDGEMLDCSRGTTPLHLAARSGHRDMVLLLLQAHAELPLARRGADLRCIKDADRRLPYHFAVARHHDHLVALLDPRQPLAPALQGWANPAAVGPRRLAALAADALRAKLSSALDASAAAAAAAAGGASCASAGAAGHPALSLQLQCSPREGYLQLPDTAGVDEQDQCPVCLESMCAPNGLQQQSQQCWVVLSACHHGLCLGCAQQLQGQLELDLMRCPLCRAPVADLVVRW